MLKVCNSLWTFIVSFVKVLNFDKRVFYYGSTCEVLRLRSEGQSYGSENLVDIKKPFVKMNGFIFLVVIGAVSFIFSLKT